MGIRFSKPRDRPPLAYGDLHSPTGAALRRQKKGGPLQQQQQCPDSGVADDDPHAASTIRYKKVSPFPQIVVAARMVQLQLQGEGTVAMPVSLRRRRPLLLVFGEANMPAEKCREMTKYGFEELRSTEESLSSPVVIYVEWGSCVAQQTTRLTTAGVIPRKGFASPESNSSSSRPISRNQISITELPSESDLKSVSRLLKRELVTGTIDRRFIFATGIGSGGTFCFQLAQSYADTLICAIAPVCALIAMQGRERQPWSFPCPTCLIVGDKDPFVPITGGALREFEIPPPTFRTLTTRRMMGLYTRKDTVSQETTQHHQQEEEVISCFGFHPTLAFIAEQNCVAVPVPSTMHDEAISPTTSQPQHKLLHQITSPHPLNRPRPLIYTNSPTKSTQQDGAYESSTDTAVVTGGRSFFTGTGSSGTSNRKKKASSSIMISCESRYPDHNNYRFRSATWGGLGGGGALLQTDAKGGGRRNSCSTDTVNGLEIASSSPQASSCNRLEKKPLPPGSLAIRAYMLHGGGHCWSGGKRHLPKSISGKISKKINACMMIWQFFCEVAAAVIVRDDEEQLNETQTIVV